MKSTKNLFEENFLNVINQNLSNSNFNIKSLCKETGISRSNLYRKLKTNKNTTPVNFIRNKRIEMAAEILLKIEISIFDVSVYVGFNSHSYFSMCFKSVYGQSPSEYIKSHKKPHTIEE